MNISHPNPDTTPPPCRSFSLKHRRNRHTLLIFLFNFLFTDLLVEGCPVNVTKQTDQGMNDTEVCWDLPILHADVIAEITANFNSGDRFQIGVYTVNITAATGSGTFDVCTFHVNIVGKIFCFLCFCFSQRNILLFFLQYVFRLLFIIRNRDQ